MHTSSVSFLEIGEYFKHVHLAAYATLYIILLHMSTRKCAQCTIAQYTKHACLNVRASVYMKTDSVRRWILAITYVSELLKCHLRLPNGTEMLEHLSKIFRASAHCATLARRPSRTPVSLSFPSSHTRALKRLSLDLYTPHARAMIDIDHAHARARTHAQRASTIRRLSAFSRHLLAPLVISIR